MANWCKSIEDFKLLMERAVLRHNVSAIETHYLFNIIIYYSNPSESIVIIGIKEVKAPLKKN